MSEAAYAAIWIKVTFTDTFVALQYRLCRAMCCEKWNVCNNISCTWKNKTILNDYAFSGRRLDRRSGQLSTRGRLPQGHYEVKVKVYDVVWKHEVISMVTVVVKEIDDVAIANAGSLRIQGTFAHVKNLGFLTVLRVGVFWL